MKRNKDFHKYISIFFTLLFLLLHFFIFVRTNNCKVLNTGFAFGIGGDINLKYSLRISMSLITLIVLGILLFKEYIYRDVLIGILILSTGNFMDRIFGGICDYISLPKILFFHIPVFNLLDLGIVLGTCVIFIDIIRNIWKK